MNTPHRKRLFWGRHLIAFAALVGLEGFLRIRRHMNRAFLRPALAILSLGLLVMVLSSLFALGRITRSVESLVGDSLLGAETAVAMRATVRAACRRRWTTTSA